VRQTYRVTGNPASAVVPAAPAAALTRESRSPGLEGVAVDVIIVLRERVLTTGSTAFIIVIFREQGFILRGVTLDLVERLFAGLELAGHVVLLVGRASLVMRWSLTSTSGTRLSFP
jgi:hypothetical protein